MNLFDYSELINYFKNAGWSALADATPKVLELGLDVGRYGDIPRWQQALEALPDLELTAVNLDASAIQVGCKEGIGKEAKAQLIDALKGLHPWRKGPFNFFGVDIDTEWRSDWKWDRLAQHIEPLSGKAVLDVGCGSGYHCWRMAGVGADFVLGIDPTPLFVMQYWAVQKYLRNPKVWVVPMRMEELPPKLACFDTVFSMGILYHRRSPFDHLQELKDALAEDGQLVLETLVIDGSAGEVLVPEGRYAKMGNVWFIPSVPTLLGWLKKMKFRDVKVVDVSITSLDEQRSTDWMQFHSLVDFLDSENNNNKTLEGYPSPRRAILTARK